MASMSKQPDTKLLHEQVKAALQKIRAAAHLLVPDAKPDVVKNAKTELCVQSTILRLSHDQLYRSTLDTRQAAFTDQRALVNMRQRLSALRYEKASLVKSIQKEKKLKLSQVNKLGIIIPNELVGGHIKIGNENAINDQMMQSLSKELAKRKKAKENVINMRKKIENEKLRLREMREKYGAIPRLIANIGTAVKPFQAHVDVDSCVVTEAEALQCKQLPTHLYILCREALAYRSMSPKRLSVEVKEGAAIGQGIFKDCGKRVILQVHGGPECSEKTLVVEWKWHPTLNVASALGRVDTMTGDDWLCELYPGDYGVESPNAANAHLVEDCFQWDVQKAGGGRPFEWANMACGLGCLGDIGGEGWVGEANALQKHVRFSSIIDALYLRLLHRIKLDKELKELVNGNLGVGWKEAGLKAEPKAKLLDFVRLPREERGAEYIKFRELWCGVVGCNDVKVKFIAGLRANYPEGPPKIHLKSLEERGKVTEKDLAGLGFECNSVGKPEGEGYSCLLSSVLWTLLKGVERLAEGSEAGDLVDTANVPQSLASLLK